MRAKDIMTTNLVTVGPEATVADVAKLLLDRHISGVPVVDADQRILGILSEGDLLRRVENDTAARHSWWLAKLLSGRDKAADYVKAHGRKVSEIMTRNVLTIGEDATLSEIAQVLEQNRIKRVPVVEAGKLVGIVSRANLVQAIASSDRQSRGSTSADDGKIREELTRELTKEAGLTKGQINVIVENGKVQMWGLVNTQGEKAAAQVAAENVPGVTSIENHLALVPPYYGAE
ncbi:MAG: CBS domain-containing protein [Hyphomicrobiaceae bacterium]|nr:CBS domain-containing protein [Hyphomicrobiaceae bacterium]